MSLSNELIMKAIIVSITPTIITPIARIAISSGDSAVRRAFALPGCRSAPAAASPRAAIPGILP